MTYSILLTGNGETSRANVEALLDDHYYANGEDGTIVIAFNQRPSQGQVWAAQLFNNRKLNVVVFAKPNAFLDSITHATLVETDTPLKDAAEKFKDKNPSSFILWGDEDPDSLDALAFSKASEIKAYDLCDGLSEITPSNDIKPSVQAPEMPKVESSTKSAEEQEYEDDEEEIDEDEEDYDEAVDEIYAGIEALVELIANRVVQKLGEEKSPK